MPPTPHKLTEQAMAELMKVDLLDLSVDSVGGPAPNFRGAAHACVHSISCIVHTHAWAEPADDR